MSFISDAKKMVLFSSMNDVGGEKHSKRGALKFYYSALTPIFLILYVVSFVAIYYSQSFSATLLWDFIASFFGQDIAQGATFFLMLFIQLYILIPVAASVFSFLFSVFSKQEYNKIFGISINAALPAIMVAWGNALLSYLPSNYYVVYPLYVVLFLMFVWWAIIVFKGAKELSPRGNRVIISFIISLIILAVLYLLYALAGFCLLFGCLYS